MGELGKESALGEGFRGLEDELDDVIVVWSVRWLIEEFCWSMGIVWMLILLKRK